MNDASVTVGQRVFFGAFALLGLWVGVWGFFLPGQVDRAIPWSVPPLHARVLGAVYLSGAAFMVLSMISRTYAEVRVVVRGIAVWTGLLLVVSLFYLDTFDWRRTQVWIWFGAYLAFPAIALLLMWRDRASQEPSDGPGLPAWARRYLLAQGVLITALALALLFAPGLMVGAWPWKLTRMLAQIYAGPFLAYGVMSLMLSRRRTWREVRVAVTATLVFALGVLSASWMHRGLFSPGTVSTIAWFGGFGLAAAVLGLLTKEALTRR